MTSEYVKMAIAWMLSLLGALGVIAGLLGFFGPVVINFSPWVLTTVGFVVLLFGYGIMNTDLDEMLK